MCAYVGACVCVFGCVRVGACVWLHVGMVASVGVYECRLLCVWVCVGVCVRVLQHMCVYVGGCVCVVPLCVCVYV